MGIWTQMVRALAGVKRYLGDEGQPQGDSGQTDANPGRDNPAVDEASTDSDHRSPVRDPDVEIDHSQLETPSDVYDLYGISPEEFILDHLRKRDGWMQQQTLHAITNWSESSISRYLSDMEAQGLIDRKQVGRGKTIVLPESSPETEKPDEPGMSD